jgi:hypothetical protein
MALLLFVALCDAFGGRSLRSRVEPRGTPARLASPKYCLSPRQSHATLRWVRSHLECGDGNSTEISSSLFRLGSLAKCIPELQVGSAV